ncbi:MAG: RAD55 family ATPase [Pirellulales bacterium]
MPRYSTGVPGLDDLLGGGLLPGTLTVVVGATGAGKTQLGLQFAHAGQQAEGQRGVLFDMTCRGDSQSHAEYARRMFDWNLQAADANRPPDLESFFDQAPAGEYLKVFDYQGRRVTRRDLEEEMWRQWQTEMVRKLNITIGFFYGHFARGVRRAVIDGIEPADRASDSIQFELFEYVQHQILRKEAEWVARDLFRQDYLRNAPQIAAHAYDHNQIASLLLYTSHETMLEGLIERRLDEGDLLAGANTVIYMGKIREGQRLTRALYIPKHRGSACADEIVPYSIDDHGMKMA